MKTDRLTLLGSFFALFFLFPANLSFANSPKAEEKKESKKEEKEENQEKKEANKDEKSEKKDEHKAPEKAFMTEKPAKQSSRDVRLPRPLVKRLEREYREFLNKLEVSSKESIKRGLLMLSVELTQEKEGPLHEDVRVVTPPGGGVVDLADFVTPFLGAFRVRFNVAHDDGTVPLGMRVFFVSRAKTRNIGGEDYGAGCNQYMEITTKYYKKIDKQGIEAFTSAQRYVSVLGGTFVFISFEREAMRVGTISFTDSRYLDFLCEDK
jgi:hypothetical protein